MSVLIMMPLWEDAFTGWMRRMLLCISEDLAAIAVNNSQGNSSWGGKVPVISLYPPAKEIRYFSRLLGFLGLSLGTETPGAETILRRTIRGLPITHILCQYGTYAVKFMSVWRETDIPLFIHFHGYDATFDLRFADQPEKRFFTDEYLSNLKELEQRSIFIANSEFTKSLLMDVGLSPTRIVTKCLGVPVPDQQRIHNRNKVQILHVGRLVDFKSPDRTLKAFEIAKSRGLDGHLIIAGDGPLKAMCELFRLRSPFRDSIHILGTVGPQEAQNLVSESDIFTAHNVTGEITRQTECLGVSILEAMASGLPVVGTRIGGVLETVVDGETGILNSPGDVEAQADAFLRLAKDPDLRQQMGDAGRARVAALFSPQQEAEQLRRIMNLPQPVSRE